MMTIIGESFIIIGVLAIVASLVVLATAPIESTRSDFRDPF